MNDRRSAFARGRAAASGGRAALACACLGASLLLAGCCASPWSRFPIHTAPDRSCRTGSPAGYDVYVWSCLENQKVVVYQYSAEMSCQEAQKETVACGGTTPIELKLGSAVAPGCNAVPDAVRWQP